MGLTVFPYNAQCMGQRNEQQDYFAFSDIFNPNETALLGNVAVLSDGMGGIENGRQAAETAVHTFMKTYRECEASVMNAMYEAVLSANRAVLELGSGGATLAAVVVMGNRLWHCSVGDSRIYLLRHGIMSRINTEHNYKAELMKEYKDGKIEYADVIGDPEGESLTAYIGQYSLRYVDISEEEKVSDGDKILICSDGVYRALLDSEIRECLLRESSDTAADITKAVCSKKAVGQDNATALVLEIREMTEG